MPLPRGSYDLLIGWGGGACYATVVDDAGTRTVGPATREDPSNAFGLTVTAMPVVNLAPDAVAKGADVVGCGTPGGAAGGGPCVG